jgi:hypothetical protein
LQGTGEFQDMVVKTGDLNEAQRNSLKLYHDIVVKGKKVVVIMRHLGKTLLNCIFYELGIGRHL